MSKLSDRIRKTRLAAPKPIGFTAAAASAPARTMLIIVRLSSRDVGKTEDAAEKGPDAIIVENPNISKFKSAAGKSGEALCGAAIDNADREAVVSMAEAGADFVEIDFESGLAEAMLEENLGYVLAIGLEAKDSELRLIGDLPIDALIVPPPKGKLTLGDALSLRRIATLARTPLFIEANSDIDVSALQALRSAGVVGVIVDESAIGKLARLRKTIESLPSREPKREDHREVSLPMGVRASTDGGREDEEDDEDEGDYE
ncbi:MAG: hypothetical protein IH957_02070 [Chloroflexi bacterium]|nr:hypothetical protein [Chloroflexota bacterium]